jgi:hypothetical protein
MALTILIHEAGVEHRPHNLYPQGWPDTLYNPCAIGARPLEMALMCRWTGVAPISWLSWDVQVHRSAAVWLAPSPSLASYFGTDAKLDSQALGGRAGDLCSIWDHKDIDSSQTYCYEAQLDSWSLELESR